MIFERTHPNAEHNDYADRSRVIWADAFAKLFEHKVPIFGSAIDRKGFDAVRQHTGIFEGITPYAAAFADCLRQVDNYAHTSLKDEQVLWISDHAGHYEPDMKKMLDVVRELQRMHFADVYPTLQFAEPHIAHITEDLFWAFKGIESVTAC